MLEVVEAVNEVPSSRRRCLRDVAEKRVTDRSGTKKRGKKRGWMWQRLVSLVLEQLSHLVAARRTVAASTRARERAGGRRASDAEREMVRER